MLSKIKLITRLFYTVLGADYFDIRPLGNTDCLSYYVEQRSVMWDPSTHQKTNDPNFGLLTCQSFTEYCPEKNRNCYESIQRNENYVEFYFSDLEGFNKDCLTCFKNDHIHGTIIFNAFIFCQVN